MAAAMWGMSDEPILMRSQVRAWQARREEIAEVVQALRDEDAALAHKLDAVRVILGDVPADDIAGDAVVPAATAEPVAGEAGEPQQKRSFPDSVLAAVGALGGAPRPNEIRTWLCERGATDAIRYQAAKPYFYAVLMRHAAAGRLIKVGDGYSLPTSSAQAEAGGLAPPGDSQLHS